MRALFHAVFEKGEIRHYLGQSVQNRMTQSSLKGGLSFKIKKPDLLRTYRKTLFSVRTIPGER